MTLRPRHLPIGTRVRLKTSPYGHQTASLGIFGIVVHVNATPYITGTIYAEPPHQTGNGIAFRPDGWPLPDGVYPPYFVADSTKVEIIPEDAPKELCKVTTTLGGPISPEEVDRLIAAPRQKRKIT